MQVTVYQPPLSARFKAFRSNSSVAISILLFSIILESASIAFGLQRLVCVSLI